VIFSFFFNELLLHLQKFFVYKKKQQKFKKDQTGLRSKTLFQHVYFGYGKQECMGGGSAAG
jgi:hypothetical protein